MPDSENRMDRPWHCWSWQLVCGWHAAASCPSEAAQRSWQIHPRLQLEHPPPEVVITLSHWHILTTTHLDKDVFAPGLIHVTQCLPPSKDNHCQMLDFKHLIYGFIMYACILIKNKPENQDEDALGDILNNLENNSRKGNRVSFRSGNSNVLQEMEAHLKI